MREFSIGRLARAAGSAVQTVRWYEQQGLMPPPARTSGGQRRYDESALRRLLFIRHARDLGFSIADIRALLTLADSPAAPCAEADAIARRQLAATRRRIAELRLLERELARMVEECPADDVRHCRVIEVLSDHALCRYHGRADEKAEGEEA